MPSWSEFLDLERQNQQANPNAGAQIISQQKTFYLSRLSELTGRNTILYFSSWMNKPSSPDISINDKDMNAFMETVYKLDKSKGLDLILHTPGGDIAATEQIIYYLHSIFDGNIRAIIPQMAMSAGSIIAVSCKSIMMGKQSCLGPFDPQINNMPSQSVISEFYKAVDDVKNNPASLGLWQTIISKLNPTFLTICEQANKMSEELTEQVLDKSAYDETAKAKIKEMFVNSQNSKTHSRHINRDKCRDAGLQIEELEANQEIQDAVLSIHHCCMILAEQTPIIKLVENNIGKAYVIQQPQVQMPIQRMR